MSKDLFSVTISRINEGLHQPPYETRAAHTVQIMPDGTLSITGENGGRMLQAGLWDGIQVKRLQDLPEGHDA